MLVEDSEDERDQENEVPVRTTQQTMQSDTHANGLS